MVAAWMYRKAAAAAGIYSKVAVKMDGNEKKAMLGKAANMYERSKNFKVAENMDKKVAAEMTKMGEKKKKQY
jgi:hypothetical protein